MPIHSTWSACHSLLWVLPFLGTQIRVYGQVTPAPTFQSTAKEITLDLVARDGKGRIVRDLRAEDLQVFDSGVPITLTSLHLRDARQPNNNSQQRSQPVVLLFDALPSDAAALARSAADEMLRVAGDDIDFAVLVLRPRLEFLQKFTHNRNSLLEAVASATRTGRGKANVGYDSPENAMRVLASETSHSSPLDGQNEITEATDLPGKEALILRNLLSTSQEYAMAQNASPALNALLALAQQMGALPGRKSIVYFSDTLPTDALSAAFLERMARAANRSSVSVYTFDVSGISIWAHTQSSRMLTAANGAAVAPDTSAPRTLKTGNLDSLDVQERSLRSDRSQSGLRDLAASTGGFFVENSNDLRKAARRFVDDVNGYFEATFVPPAHRDNGEFYPIEVRTARRGIRILARAGYVAKASSVGGAESFEAPLLEALSAADLPRDREIRAAMVCFGRESQDRVTASLAVEIPLREMTLLEDSDSKFFGMHFTALAIVRDSSGAILQKISRDVPYRGALDQEGRVKQDVYSFTGRFSVLPGEYRLDAVVLDRNSGKTGAWHSLVHVEASAGQSVSDVVLAQRFEPLTPDQPASDPFVYGKARVVPDLAREFPSVREAPVWVFFRRSHPQVSSGDSKVSLEIRRGEELLATSELKPADDSSGTLVPYLARLSLKNLMPGRYELIAKVEEGVEATKKSVFLSITGPPVVKEVAPVPEVAPTTQNETPSNGVPDSAPLLASAQAAPASSGPDDGELHRILNGARQHALEFAGSLPNFSCIESTRRSTGSDGVHWRDKDSYVELLQLVNGEETRTPLEVDGHRAHITHEEIDGAVSVGEYGSTLRAIFQERAGSTFAWKDWSTLNGRRLAVFSFRLDASSPTYVLRVNGREAIAGAQGLVYIDPLTMAVHRVNMTADGIPKGFPYRESSFAIDYEFVTVGDHDYVLPSAAEIQIRRANGKYQKNRLTFRDYRRFGAKSSISFQEK